MNNFTYSGRHNPTPAECVEIIKLYEQGMSVYDIAKRLDISPRDIAYKLYSEGVEFRDRQDTVHLGPAEQRAIDKHMVHPDTVAMQDYWNRTNGRIGGVQSKRSTVSSRKKR